MTNAAENAPGASPRDGRWRRLLLLDARSLGLFRIVVALFLGALFIAPPSVVSGLTDHCVWRPGLNHPGLIGATRVIGALGALGLLVGFRSGVALALVLAALLAWGGFSPRFDARNGGVLVAMLASMFVVPIGARFSCDALASALRRGIRLDRRPADAVPAMTALAPSLRTIAFSVIAAAAGLWTAALWAASRSAFPGSREYDLLLLVPLATLVLLLRAGSGRPPHAPRAAHRARHGFITTIRAGSVFAAVNGRRSPITPVACGSLAPATGRRICIRFRQLTWRRALSWWTP